MPIGIDLDGVIADFATHFCKVAETFGLTCNINEYPLGVSIEDWKRVYDWMIDTDEFLNLPIYDGAWAWLTSMKYHGLEPVYLTRRRPVHKSEAREYSLQRQTKIWACRHNLPNFRDIHFVQDKGKWCVEHGVEVLVEDYLQDAEKWNMLRLRNGHPLRVLLIDRPWNGGDYVRFGEYDYPFRYRGYPPLGVLR